MPDCTVLISCAGRRVGLMNCVKNAAQQLGFSVRVIASDMKPELSPACQLADQAFRIPDAADPAFVPALVELCRREGVHLLIPTIDPELMPIAYGVNRLREAGTEVNISASSVVEVARDKLRTATALAE